MHVENLLSLKSRVKTTDPYVYDIKPEVHALLKGYELTADVVTLSNSGGVSYIKLYLKNKTHRAACYISQMPWNCGGLVLGHFNFGIYDYDYDAPRISTEQSNELRKKFMYKLLELFKYMRYTQIIMTVNSDGWIPMFKEMGWEEHESMRWVNKRTNNAIYVLTYTIDFSGVVERNDDEYDEYDDEEDDEDED